MKKGKGIQFCNAYHKTLLANVNFTLMRVAQTAKNLVIKLMESE